MNEKKYIAEKLLNSFKNMSGEAPQILQKIITTLFERINTEAYYTDI